MLSINTNQKLNASSTGLCNFQLCGEGSLAQATACLLSLRIIIVKQVPHCFINMAPTHQYTDR